MYADVNNHRDSSNHFRGINASTEWCATSVPGLDEYVGEDDTRM